MPTSTGGPNGPYIIVPPPPPPPPITLYIPESVRQTANPEQLERIAVIELEFAQRVGNLVNKAYGDILSIVREKAAE